MSEVMAAVLLMGHGGLEQLQYRTDVPVPTLEADQVLLRVGAAGINNTDINTRTGWYARSVREGNTAENASQGMGAAQAEDGGWSRGQLRFPRIQGADVCGRIVAVGDQVPADRIGERVLIDPVLRSPVNFRPYEMGYFGSEWDGGFAQYTKVPGINAVRIQSDLSDVELASFPCSYSTAENMLTRVDLAAEETILITGASGGVGSALIQLAKRRGARVIAVAGARKQEVIQSLGADQVLAREADLLASVGAEQVDVIADVVGGSQVVTLLEILKRGGRYVCSGAVAGPMVEIDLRTIYLKDLRLFGATVLDREVFPALISYLEQGEIQPLVAQTFPLQEIAEAQKIFMRKDHVGKLVLVPPE